MNKSLPATMANPCQACGACCAHFRCSFHWSEASDVQPDGVPVEFTEDLTSFRRAMKGTNRTYPYCVALIGEIGHAVACVIYERRPSVCREFAASYVSGEPNEQCDQARHAYGLSPLAPEDWEAPPETPQVPRRPGRFRPAA